MIYAGSVLVQFQGSFRATAEQKQFQTKEMNHCINWRQRNEFLRFGHENNQQKEQISWKSLNKNKKTKNKKKKQKKKLQSSVNPFELI